MRRIRASSILLTAAVAANLLLNAAPGASPRIAAAQTSPVGFAVDSNADILYCVNLATGATTAIGNVGFADVDGLTFDSNGVLFGTDDASDMLITINLTTGAGTAVGKLGLDTVSPLDTGLTFDPQGNLFVVEETGLSLSRVNRNTGAATFIGSTFPFFLTGLTARGSTLFALTVAGPGQSDSLATVDKATGAVTVIGPLTNVNIVDGGLDFDGNGTLWGIDDGNGGAQGRIFTVNPNTGVATIVATTITGFDSLAINPNITSCGGGGGGGGGNNVVVYDPNNDDEKKKKETEEQKQQRERTNRYGLDEYRTEGNVMSHGLDDGGPFVVIANRDGLVKVRLGKQVGKITVCVGDYLEASGVKQHELLYEAEDVTVSKKSRSGSCITAN
ncbi:MAG: hypothetical protein U0821_10835 [Chloroflexota bacterium]